MIKIKPIAKPKLKKNDVFVSFVFGPKGRKTGRALFRSSIETAFNKAKQEGFAGQPTETCLVELPSGPLRRVLLVGCGPDSDSTLETIRVGVSFALKRVEKYKNGSVYFRLPQLGSLFHVAQAGVEGALLSQYQYLTYRNGVTPTPLPSLYFVGKSPAEAKELGDGIRQGVIFSDAVSLTRDLINCPPSDMTPEDFLKTVRKHMGKGVRLTVFDKKKIAKMGMGGLLGVNRGSAKAPLFLHFVYKPKGKAKRKIGICGKGITFDSGGLSLKPPKSMETMKHDMSGAAAVAGVFKALSVLKPKVEVHGFTPLTENLPGENAVKPGDVLRAMNGKTIEVLNTDAEGRLVLADGLSYASKQKIDELFDVATLTGAAVVALGNEISAIMSVDDKLTQKIKEASIVTGEKVWELPLDPEFEAHIKSPIADIKNMGRPMQAGTIIGGMFLKEFVRKGLPWAHLDIAGTAWTDAPLPLTRHGATGSFVRTFLTHILSYN